RSTAKGSQARTPGTPSQISAANKTARLSPHSHIHQGRVSRSEYSLAAVVDATSECADATLSEGTPLSDRRRAAGWGTRTRPGAPTRRADEAVPKKPCPKKPGRRSRVEGVEPCE